MYACQLASNPAGTFCIDAPSCTLLTSSVSFALWQAFASTGSAGV